MLPPRMAHQPVANDPGCVKTHTSAKCEKWNSPMLHRALCTQQDLTLATRNSSEIFYARGRCLSFHTAKTQSGHERAAFAAMHAPDVLYVVRDRWLSGKPMKRREFQTRDAEMNLARFIGELSH